MARKVKVSKKYLRIALNLVFSCFFLVSPLFSLLFFFHLLFSFFLLFEPRGWPFERPKSRPRGSQEKSKNIKAIQERNKEETREKQDLRPFQGTFLLTLTVLAFLKT